MQDVMQALFEVGIIFVSSFLAVWAGVAFFSLTNLSGSAGAYLHSFFISGEAPLISCAMIGPLIYIITKKYGKFADPLTLRFPFGTAFSLMIMLIWVFAGIVFVAKKANDLYKANILDDGAMTNVSVIITVAAVALLFFATIFRNCMERMDPAKEMHDDQESFVRQYNG